MTNVTAQSPTGNPAAEEYYWRKIHRQEREREKNEENLNHELREQVKAMLPELVDQGSAFQQRILLEPDGGSAFVPPQPSIINGKSDYLLLGTMGILLFALVSVTLRRGRREAEIRVLSGTYLADGKEAAFMSMPDLFQAPALTIKSAPASDEKAQLPVELLEPNAEFFAKAPARMIHIRKCLSDFGKAFDDSERQQVLVQLRESVLAIKDDSSGWYLRPAWQMSSALEVLLERLINKTKELTPSTLRTVASAVDVLGEICVCGVRPDLIITPPISVLAVDDDPLCLRAVVFALEKAGLTPDVCGDGEHAVACSTTRAYDVIFMDIQMPGIDGLEATHKIRETEKNGDTPVIFVTIRSDFQTRAESSRIGGTDLIAKPFLQFEITVKALTFAMRKRLQLAASLRRASQGGVMHAPAVRVESVAA